MKVKEESEKAGLKTHHSENEDHGIQSHQFSSVQSLGHIRLFATPWTTAHQASLSIINSQSSPKPMSIESVMPSNHLILCRPLLLQPSVFPSIRVFSNESPLHIRWPKYWSFSFSISPSNEYSGLISFRMDLLDLPGVQGTLKSLLQHHSSKASILWHSAFFIVQLLHPHMTAGKTTALTRWTFVSKVMSLVFNMLSKLVITFLPRSKRLLISWQQSPFAVILEPPKIKSATVSTVSSPITSWQIDRETVTGFIFRGSKITSDSDCNHEIKRCLLLGRKAMKNLDSISKTRDITLLTKVCIL